MDVHERPLAARDHESMHVADSRFYISIASKKLSLFTETVICIDKIWMYPRLSFA